MTDVGDLFEREPISWGLRGDPHLWRLMRERFRGVPLPDSVDELYGLIKDVFVEVTGESMHIQFEKKNIYVPSLATGSGMSDGSISRDFWGMVAVALITDRWITATGREDA